MTSTWIILAIIVPTVVVSIIVRLISRHFDGLLLILSGATSLFLAVFASTTMRTQAADGMMTLAMSERSFDIGVLSPVFAVATLTVMRGLFKFMQE